MKATSAADRTPVHYADRSFCELDWVVDGIRRLKLEWAFVEDSVLPEPRSLIWGMSATSTLKSGASCTPSGSTKTRCCDGVSPSAEEAGGNVSAVGSYLQCFRIRGAA